MTDADDILTMTEQQLKERFPVPRELPDMVINGELLVADFGTSCITTAHIVHCVDWQRRKRPGEALRILMIGETATNVKGEIASVGANPFVSEVTHALAMVSRSKIGQILGNIYIGISRNPYPTRLFTDEQAARRWLEAQ